MKPVRKIYANFINYEVEFVSLYKSVYYKI